ncbi:MAG: cupredoxin domain-containing protein [Nitrosotalea sp.]
MLRFYHLMYAVVIATICYSVSYQSAQAYDAQVTIVNGTANHCRPNLSCYSPFQVSISVGDTVTWINQDNRTHTVTTGTTNYGPQGIFDSGTIKPGQSFTQFFGSAGKYGYYDKTDMWPSGYVVVSKGFSHAELSWVNDSLTVEKQNYTSNGLVITKQIQNTGNADANSIIFTLKIKNQTSLFYNGLVKLDIPAKQSVPVIFVWSNPPDGQYQLFFDANSANNAGDMNANDDRSLDLISIPSSTPAQNEPVPIIHENFTLSDNAASIPEFSDTSFLVLIISLVSTVVLSARSGLKL